MRIRISQIRNRKMFVGYNEDGNRVYGTLGDEFSVPKDLSKKTAVKLLRSGIAESVEEKVETAVKEIRKTAVKAIKSVKAIRKPRRTSTVKKKK